MGLVLKYNGFGNEEGLVWGGIALELAAESRLNWRTMQALLIPEMDHSQLNNGPLFRWMSV